MSNVTLTVRLPADLHKKLAALAEREVSSLNREIIIAVRAHLDTSRRAR
jgi:predicted HicB family RNase H-like nuclease